MVAGTEGVLQTQVTITQPRDHFLTVNGRRHHYLEWIGGAGTLVLLHGGNSSARGTWVRSAPAFVDRYRIIAPDHRGHGETAWDPAAGYTLSNYVGDFESVVAQLGLPPFDLAGHSLGGMIGLAFAAQHPDQVHRLVLIDSGPRDFKPEEIERIRTQSRRPLTFATRGEAEAFARQSFPDAARNRPLDYGFIQRRDGMWTWRADVEGLSRARYGDDRLRGELWTHLAGIQCPTLILVGGRSFFHDQANIARIRAANSLVVVVTYPEAHHWVHDDEPERFARDVRRFFAET
jgi:pimeloyl-ACP methyl ester carboxylesterase